MSSAVVTGSASSGISELQLSIREMSCAARPACADKKLNAMGGRLATANFAIEKATVTAPALESR